MKSNRRTVLLSTFISALLYSTAIGSSGISTIDFSSPTTAVQTSNATTRTLGGTGTYSYGTWIYSAVGEINVSSSGVAKIRNNASGNPRAIAVIFDSSSFIAGTEYTLSFDVIGTSLGDDSGRFWLAEVSGISGSNSVITNVAQGSAWSSAAKPFTTTSASLNFLADSASNGYLLSGENTDTTTKTTFNFTYTAGTALAFAVGTYNNQFAIDNFSIAEAVSVPEPTTYALVLGVAALGIVAYRRRRC